MKYDYTPEQEYAENDGDHVPLWEDEGESMVGNIHRVDEPAIDRRVEHKRRDLQ